MTPDEFDSLNLLDEMYRDGYFPNHLVDKVKAVLKDVADQIASTKPENLEGVYPITHAATERINDLQEAFWAAESEIETAARESIADGFFRLVTALGFEPDMEELIATRDW